MSNAGFRVQSRNLLVVAESILISSNWMKFVNIKNKVNQLKLVYKAPFWLKREDFFWDSLILLIK